MRAIPVRTVLKFSNKHILQLTIHLNFHVGFIIITSRGIALAIIVLAILYRYKVKHNLNNISKQNILPGIIQMTSRNKQKTNSGGIGTHIYATSKDAITSCSLWVNTLPNIFPINHDPEAGSYSRRYANNSSSNVSQSSSLQLPEPPGNGNTTIRSELVSEVQQTTIRTNKRVRFVEEELQAHQRSRQSSTPKLLNRSMSVDSEANCSVRSKSSNSWPANHRGRQSTPKSFSESMSVDSETHCTVRSSTPKSMLSNNLKRNADRNTNALFSVLSSSKIDDQGVKRRRKINTSTSDFEPLFSDSLTNEDPYNETTSAKTIRTSASSTNTMFVDQTTSPIKFQPQIAIAQVQPLNEPRTNQSNPKVINLVFNF